MPKILTDEEIGEIENRLPKPKDPKWVQGEKDVAVELNSHEDIPNLIHSLKEARKRADALEETLSNEREKTKQHIDYLQWVVDTSARKLGGKE